MLASITPLGERGRGRSWGRTVVAFVIGAIVGGAALGAAAASLAVIAGGLPTALRWSLVAAAALGLVVAEALGRLPSWRRQVDVRWLSEYRGWVVGLGYGAQLGAAVVTIVPTAATWLMLAVAVGSASPAVAVLLCVIFALTRALPVLAGAHVLTPQSLHALHRRLDAWARPVDRTARGLTALAACGSVAVLAAAVAR